jgi:hypothetical protein
MFAYAIAFFGAVGAIICLHDSIFAALPRLPVHASGSWQSDHHGRGRWSTDVAIRGNAVMGEITMPGKLSRKLLTGSVTRHRLEFRVQDAEKSAIFTGVVNASGVFGNYVMSDGDTGTWIGTWWSEAPEAGSQWPPDAQTLDELSAASAEVADVDSDSVSTQAITVGDNVLVTHDGSGGPRPGGQQEPEVAVDAPHDPSRLVAVANDWFGGSVGLGYYFSTTGGTSWLVGNKVQIPPLNGESFGQAFDPYVSFDSVGRAFYSGAASDGISSCTGGKTNGKHAVVVARSLPGTTTFQQAVTVRSYPRNSNARPDRPVSIADRVGTSPFKDNVYVSWFQFACSGGTGMSGMPLARSTNNGLSFTVGPFINDADHGMGAPAFGIGFDGTLHVAWSGQNPLFATNRALFYDRCTNGGTLCGTDQVLIQQVSPQIGEATLTIDHWPNGSNYIYLAVKVGRTPAGDIYFTRSINNGNSWVLPLRAIASAPEEEYFPVMCVDQNHIVHLTYYRSTSTTNRDFSNIFMISSADGGDTWSAPVQLNDEGPFNSDRANIGDYMGMDCSTVRHPVWADNRDGDPNLYTATVSGC